MELLFLQMKLFELWIGAEAYIIVLDFWREIPAGHNFWANFYVFHARGQIWKMGERSLTFFPALDQNMKKRLGLL